MSVTAPNHATTAELTQPVREQSCLQLGAHQATKHQVAYDLHILHDRSRGSGVIASSVYSDGRVADAGAAGALVHGVVQNADVGTGVAFPPEVMQQTSDMQVSRQQGSAKLQCTWCCALLVTAVMIYHTQAVSYISAAYTREACLGGTETAPYSLQMSQGQVG